MSAPLENPFELAFERDIERQAESEVAVTSSSSLSAISTNDSGSPRPQRHPSNAAVSEDVESKEHGDGWVLSPSAGVNRGFDWPALDSTSTRDQASRGSGGEEQSSLNLRERLRHFTWTWFCMTMATGGIANVLYSVPFRFRGLYTIGCIVFLFNLALFIFNCVGLSLRFYLHPTTFRGSFLHPTESLFIPASLISVGTIFINITQYGFGSDTRLWLLHAMNAFYWIYCALAILFSSGIYLIMWSTQTFTIDQMTPVWIFPAYPLLITGPFAGNLAKKVAPQDSTAALDIIIGGYVLQGIGFLVSLMIYSSFIYRLMTKKLPRESLRPGMFISVGPSGFTISGIMLMARSLPKVVPDNFMGIGDGGLAAKISVVAANWMGLWLWGLALWFFIVSVGAHYSCAARGKMDFAMTWYSFIFPNTALTTATFAVAEALNENRGIRIVGCIMTIGLIITWFFVFACMIRAVKNKQILWPQKQEDKEEGGWKRDVKREKEWERRRKESMNAGGRMRARVHTMTRGNRDFENPNDDVRRSKDRPKQMSEKREGARGMRQSMPLSPPPPPRALKAAGALQRRSDK